MPRGLVFHMGQPNMAHSIFWRTWGLSPESDKDLLNFLSLCVCMSFMNLSREDSSVQTRIYRFFASVIVIPLKNPAP